MPSPFALVEVVVEGLLLHVWGVSMWVVGLVILLDILFMFLRTMWSLGLPLFQQKGVSSIGMAAEGSAKSSTVVNSHYPVSAPAGGLDR
ncbi:hypothetical protein KI387_032993, partial [Taxus chinensis]